MTEIRYRLDKTGVNPDNLVMGEVRELGGGRIRPIAPKYGTFYSDSLVIVDHITGHPLEKGVDLKNDSNYEGVDYILAEFSEEATHMSRLSAHSMFLIVNPAIVNPIRIMYQVVGAEFQNHMGSIEKIYENLLMDNRPISWLNIHNKQQKYPPLAHSHSFKDIRYGFDSLIVVLERIRNAIVLSNIPAFENLVNWVERRFDNLKTVSCKEIREGYPTDSLMTYRSTLALLDSLGVELNNTPHRIIKVYRPNVRNLENDVSLIEIELYILNVVKLSIHYTVIVRDDKGIVFEKRVSTDIVNNHSELMLQIDTTLLNDDYVVTVEVEDDFSRNLLLCPTTYLVKELNVVDDVYRPHCQPEYAHYHHR